MGQAVFFSLTSQFRLEDFSECTAHQGALAKTSNVATSFGTSDHQPWATETRPDAGSKGSDCRIVWVVERSTFSSDWPRNQWIYKVRKSWFSGSV